MEIHDYIVVGSGCSGAMTAQTLLENGARVTMIDAGIEKNNSLKNIPNKDFLTLRKSDPNQYRYLIGDKAEGVSWSKIGKGEQITPPRRYILQSVDKYIPVDSDSFSPLESLGYGGLGIGWGLQCWQYSETDLKAAGLAQTNMTRAYQLVSDRIGISATKDDAEQYTIVNLKDYQQSASMDRNHKYIYKKYTSKKIALNKRGFYLGRTPLALITQDKGRRKKYAYHDMDFYSDNDQSAWRPWITINQLRQKDNFTYIGGYMLCSFNEKQDYIEIDCLNMTDQKHRIFKCRKLVLATSALGSARVVLRSLGQKDTRLPLLCNPYSYVPCVQPKFLGKEAEEDKLGFTQLSLFFDKDHNNNQTSVASLYSYQSLMLFRLIRQLPLNFLDARILMRYMMSGIVILGIHHPDHSTALKYVELEKSSKTPTGDKLQIAYALDQEEKALNENREQEFIKAMRRMGTYRLKKIDPGYGSSIHYAGTLPFSEKQKDFTLHPSGRLHGTKNIYVADSSGFKYLPAPGLTFSLMANAHLVAESVLKHE
jgi:hypothetical protein